MCWPEAYLREPVYDDQSSVFYEAAQKEDRYEISGEGGSFLSRGSFVREYWKKIDERGWCTVMIKNTVLVFFVPFHKVLSNCNVYTVKELTSPGKVL